MTVRFVGTDCSVESSNIFPLFCFGHVAWFKAIYQQPEIVFDVHESFPKRTFRNRYTILNSQGRLDLTIPLSNRSSTNKTNEIKIDYSEDWITQHLRSIKTGYSLAPFYIHFIDELKLIFESRPTFLIDLNLILFDFTLNNLGINLTYQVSKDFPNPEKNTYWRFDKIPNKKADQISTNFYPQQFEDRNGYLPNPSILDVLFNLGPEGRLFLSS